MALDINSRQCDMCSTGIPPIPVDHTVQDFLCPDCYELWEFMLAKEVV